MKEGDVKPGMFLEDTLKTISEPVLLYVVSDNIDEHSYVVVDLWNETTSMLSYQAITGDYKEFDGDIDKAKKVVMRSVF